MNGKRAKALRRELKDLLRSESLRKAEYTVIRQTLTPKGLVPTMIAQTRKDEFRTYKRAWKKTKDVGK